VGGCGGSPLLCFGVCGGLLCVVGVLVRRGVGG